MGESNTVRSLYTMYMHLQQYCAHPSIYISTTFMQHSKQFFKKFGEVGGGGKERRGKNCLPQAIVFFSSTGHRPASLCHGLFVRL